MKLNTVNVASHFGGQFQHLVSTANFVCPPKHDLKCSMLTYAEINEAKDWNANWV